MKSLNASEMQQVSGAGHNADAVEPWEKSNSSGVGSNNSNDNNPAYKNDDTKTCANGILGGMLAESAGGPGFAIAGAIGGGVANGCLNGNSGDIGGQCNR